MLPRDLLVRCVELAAWDIPTQRWGGSVASWHSNEEVAPLALVSRAFYEATLPVLWRSIALFTLDSLKKFSEVATQLDLARRVRYLAVGTEDDIDSFSDEESVGAAICDAIRVCENLKCLYILGLDSRHLGALEEALEGKEDLQAIVCSPRVVNDFEGEGWVDQFLLRSTGIAVLPSLRFLEIEAQGCGSSGGILNSSLILQLSETLTVSQVDLTLTHLKLHCDIAPPLLAAFLLACTTLVSLDLYVEHEHPRPPIATAIQNLRRSLVNVRFISNTGENATSSGILFNPCLLTSLSSLEVLSVSSLDIPHNFFQILPPTVKGLEIVVLSGAGLGDYVEEMLEGLADKKVAVGLKELVICDDSEIWDEELVDWFEVACAARRIKFSAIEGIQEICCGESLLPFKSPTLY